MPQLWIIYALLSALFASLVAIFGKVGLKDIDTTLATAIRAVVMAIFLIITTVALGKFDLFNSVHSISGKTLAFIVLSGVAGAISWLCYFSALKIGPASGVAALDRLSVVFVFLLALLFLSEHLTLKHALGALLVSIGAMLFI